MRARADIWPIRRNGDLVHAGIVGPSVTARKVSKRQAVDNPRASTDSWIRGRGGKKLIDSDPIDHRERRQVLQARSPPTRFDTRKRRGGERGGCSGAVKTPTARRTQLAEPLSKLRIIKGRKRWHDIAYLAKCLADYLLGA